MDEADSSPARLRPARPTAGGRRGPAGATRPGGVDRARHGDRRRRLVATLGLSKTAGNQIVGRFSEVAATDARDPVPGHSGKRGKGGDPLGCRGPPATAQRRARGGNALRRERARALARSVSDQRSSRPDRGPAAGQGSVAGTVGSRSRAAGGGPLPDGGHSVRGDRTVVLGMNAARRLGISNLDQQPAIFIGDRLYQVSGLVRRSIASPH